MGLAKDLADIANDAREQLYDTSEQLRTGQTVYDRSQNDVLHHEPDNEHKQEQTQEIER